MRCWASVYYLVSVLFFVFRVVYFLSICAIVKSLGLGFKILPSPQFALLLPH